MDSLNVSFISHFVPTKENVGGPSSLPYYILKYRDSSCVMVNVYSYNLNNISISQIKEIEKDLNISIYILKLPLWFRILSSTKLMKFVGLILTYPIKSYIRLNKAQLKEITNLNPGLIWIYPHFYYRIALQFIDYKKVITGPDSSSLHSYRVLKDSSSFLSRKKMLGALISYNKDVQLEKQWNIDNTKIHFVGMDDCTLFNQICPNQNAFFILHPHFGLVDKKIKFSKERIKILLTGKFDIYTYTDAKALILILENTKNLTNLIEITFIGKGWECLVQRLIESGYICNHIIWVENYLVEIAKYDMQIFPISVGSGTKGKVLDALSTGLLCLGSKYALENICVRKNESCLLYNSIEDVPSLIEAIYNNKEKYEEVAKMGQFQVRKYHDPARISRRFWDISLK